MEKSKMAKNLPPNFKKFCLMCQEQKHIQNFKRASKFRKICNVCHIRNRESDKIMVVQDMALSLFNKLMKSKKV